MSCQATISGPSSSIGKQYRCVMLVFAKVPLPYNTSRNPNTHDGRSPNGIMFFQKINFKICFELWQYVYVFNLRSGQYEWRDIAEL